VRHTCLERKYGISMQAWIVRARDLGIISPEKATEYFRLFRSRYWHREEPGPPYPEEEPRKLKQLVLRALAEQMLTESRAAELLGTRVRTLSMPEDGAAA
jgi:Zn-dependent peptidase ImmA (M78 family)